MMRNALLWLSEQQQIFNFVRRNGLAKQFASRFVAGETIPEAVAAASALEAKGITASLDLLGESVTQATEAEAACAQYVQMVDEMAAAHDQVNVSVKLTQMGFDIDEDLCLRNMTPHPGAGRAARRLRAARHGGLRLHAAHPRLLRQPPLPAVRQPLRRGDPVVPEALGMRTSSASSPCRRECGSARARTSSRPTWRIPDKSDVDKAYVRLAEQLLEHGNYPGIATHDEAILGHVRKFVQRNGIGAERFEFQMLYGVRRDLQEQLVQSGLPDARLHPVRHAVVSRTSCAASPSAPPTSRSSSATS